QLNASARTGGQTIVIDFEDQPDRIDVPTPFPSSYQGITWTDWAQYAPYCCGYEPDGANAIYALVDGASLTFPERVFVGASFSCTICPPGDVFFELYRQGLKVATSPAYEDNGQNPRLTFLPSNYSGLVDTVVVRSLGNSIVPLQGSGWIMDDVTFI